MTDDKDKAAEMALALLARGSDVFLGLDISKTSWHVTARSGGETLMSASFPSN